MMIMVCHSSEKENQIKRQKFTMTTKRYEKREMSFENESTQKNEEKN